MKDDIKSEKSNNKDNEDLKAASTDVDEDGLYARDIDKELERVESIEGETDKTEPSSEDEDTASSDTAEQKDDSGIVAEPESTAPKPTIEDIVNKNSDKKVKQKKPVVWILLTIILFLALAGAVGYYFYEKMNQSSDVSELRAKIDTANDEKQAAVKQLADFKAQVEKEDKAAAESEESRYRTIPEFGVRYKLADNTKNVTYTYSFVPVGDKNIETILLSTTKLSEIKTDSAVESEFPCASPSAAIGQINRYPKDYYESTDDLQGASLVGEYYYAYIKNKQSCSSMASGDAILYGVKAANSIVEQLEVIPVE